MFAYGNAAVAQSVERRLGKAEVTGSIPVVSSRIYRKLEFLENSSFFYKKTGIEKED